MKKFTLTANVTVSVYTEVEAESLKEALTMAEDRELMPIVHSGGECKNDTWMCDELDGEPEKIRLLL